jgi:hypothetical protein
VRTTSILWRRLDQPGHDSARLHEDASGATLEGTAVFSESGRACRLDYRVVCDAAWRTVSGRVTGWLDAAAVEIDIAADDARTWTLNGQRYSEVQGCDDLDLSFTPATNLIAIRRVRLAVGARAPVRAAWLRFPNPALEVLDQVYERLSELTYLYESNGGTFRTELQTNDAGFVTRYPGLWQAEPIV